MQKKTRIVKDKQIGIIKRFKMTTWNVQGLVQGKYLVNGDFNATIAKIAITRHSRHTRIKYNKDTCQELRQFPTYKGLQIINNFCREKHINMCKRTRGPRSIIDYEIVN